MALSDHIKKDSPTNNFAKLNPLVTGKNFTPSTVTSDLRDGNLFAVGTSSSLATSTIIMTTGKWYWEIFVAFSGNVNSYYGVIRASLASNPNQGPWNGSFTFMQAGGMYLDSTSYTSPDGSGFSWSSNDVLGFLYDADTGSLSAYKNGVFQTTKTVSALSNIPVVTCYTPSVGSGASTSGHYNFGANSSFGGNKTSGSANAPDSQGFGDFYYNPTAIDSSALALCTANLPDFTPNVADDNPEDYFKPVVISGTNADNNDVDVGFRPDLCWLKNRNGASGHMLVDSVSGAGYALQSDNNGQQGVYNTNSDFREFTSTGFKLGAVSSYGSSNPSGTNNIISWNWKAGGNSNTFNIDGTGYSSYDNLQSANSSLPASSTSGMITPSGMSIGVKQGFSIIKYQGNNTAGATIPHGLSSVDFIIVKNISSAEHWTIYHKSLTYTHYIDLNQTNAAGNDSSVWYAAPTSSVFSFGANPRGNENNADHIAYCFTSIPGYSKFGSYIGNASADGPFVYTGFKPAFVLLKHSTGAIQHWWLYDSTRDPINYVGRNLYANLSSAEGSYSEALDFLSNGFKIRTNSNVINGNETGIYMAFAEQPTKFANAR